MVGEGYREEWKESENKIVFNSLKQEKLIGKYDRKEIYAFIKRQTYYQKNKMT